MPTFKIGDKVKVTQCIIKMLEGKTGTVEEYLGYGNYNVLIEGSTFCIEEDKLELITETPMRGTSESKCIVPACDNQATEMTDYNKTLKQTLPLFCVCHVKGHTLRVKEYSNAYSLIECETSTCSYEERVEVAVGCKEIK